MSLKPNHFVPRDRRAGFTWIEFLVILSILMIVARLALPVFFRRQWHAADQAIVRALGLPDEARFIIAALVVFGILLYGVVRACQYWRRRWLARHSSLPLPPDYGRPKA